MEKYNIRFLQKEELQLLLKFRQICEENGLCYYLTAGTLLGAVRHKGFIPWDDDIDVAMPRKDYDLLSQAASMYTGDEYVYQEYHTEPNFPYYFAKFRKRNTHVEEPILKAVDMDQGYYIDIFPLDPCSDNEKLTELFFKTIELLDCAILAKVSTEFRCGYGKKYMRFLWSCLRYFPKGFLFTFREWARVLIGIRGKKLCTVGGRHGYRKECYEANWFSGKVEMEFEGYMFPAPIGWDALLRNMYGDYMIPVREEGHFDKVGMK